MKQDCMFTQQLTSVSGRVGLGNNRGRGLVESLKSAKRIREKLVIAVIISGTEFEWAKSVCATWGHNIPHLEFYVEGQSNISIQEARRLGLQVVKLSTSTNISTRLALLQHLSEHYGKSHQWFVVVTEDTYVHMDQLEAVLGRLTQEDPLSMGLASYCQVDRQQHGGDNMVLNQVLLALLTRRIHLCRDENMKVADNHGSAVIEACVSKYLNRSISSSMQAYFVEAEEGKKNISTWLLQTQDELLRFLLTYSPLCQTKDMYILHHYYKKTQLMAAMEKTKHLQQEVEEVCSSLSPSFLSANNCNPALLEEVGQSHDQSSSKCPPIEAIITTPQPFQRKSIGKYLPWDYFNSWSIFDAQADEPNYRLRKKKYVDEEVKQVSIQALQESSMVLGKGLKFKRLLNGWVRHDPTMGNEYILDTLFTDGRNEISKRTRLLRPLAKHYIPFEDKLINSVTVNIVIPISGVSEKLTKFMSMYEKLVFIPRRIANLVLAVYGQKEVIMVKTLLAQYHIKYKLANITMVEGKGVYSRSKALHLGMSQLLPNDLAFMCDVDMDISPSFLDRCRSNALQTSRVYFPVVFKEYNMDYVYWNRKKPHSSKISRENGFWCHYGFGMVCIYKSDYDIAGGMDTSIIGWGGEDVAFFNRVKKKGIRVMNAPDVGLVHRWHSKQCAKTLSSLQYRNCMSSKSSELADKTDLARFLYGKRISPTPILQKKH